ncbi:MAG: class I SAM-dependent methyltransferase [Pseudomonadota bacterium]
MAGRLTAVAHAAIADTIESGSMAVDATAGNGHDTLFLAKAVGPDGIVFAFDVQARALAVTGHRLADAGVAERVRLIHAGHELMAEQLPDAACGHLAAVMFNLGYLPGADHAVTTAAETTTAAIATAAECLAPGAVMTVMAYRGHAPGVPESEAVAQQCEMLAASGFAVSRESAAGNGPVLWIVRAPVT